MTTPLRVPGPTVPPPASPDVAVGTGDRSRAGAVWVTGMGAFLIVAAAAVFVAVQWEHLSAQIKLGILATLTGSFLLAGRRLRAVLPATSGVLFHLGAFLIPVNVAAIAIHRQAGWPEFLLLEGATATVSWWVLDHVERSNVLRAATVAAVVVTAAGFAAVSELPTALVLAGAAVMADALRRHRPAVAWALVAGLAPAVALAAPATPAGVRAVLETLGLAGPTPQLLAAVTGILAATVIARDAHRRRDVVMVVLAAVALVLGVGTAWAEAGTGSAFNLVAIGAVFLVIELAAHLVRNDPFWDAPGRASALVAEGVVALLTPAALVCSAAILIAANLDLLTTRFWSISGPGWSAAAAGALAAAAWFVADLRRRHADGTGLGLALLLGGGFAATTVLAPLALLAGIAAATQSLPAVAISAVVLGALLIVSGRPWGHGVAVCLVLPAIPINNGDRWLTAGVTVSAAAMLACAAVIRARMGDRDVNAPLAWATAVAAVAALELGWAVSSGPGHALALLLGLAALCTAVGIICDRGSGADGVPGLGVIGRAAAVLTMLQAVDLPPREIAILAGALSATALADALGHRRSGPLFALPVTLPVSVAMATAAQGSGPGTIGIALCVLAAVGAGLQLLVPKDWGMPVLGVVVASGVAGFASATVSLSTSSTALIVLAGIGLAYSTVFGSREGAVFSALVATAGIWGHLVDGQVTALDAYLAPVAAGLLVAGTLARRGTPAVSSWVAYGPAIIMLGGSALFERMQGGHGVHALVAGSVAVAALVAGGGRRLAAPLLLGSGLLVVLTGYESMVVTRQVPTWGWLALGGTVLVAAGIVMERLDTGPVESGRRLVDVVHDRFS